ncbi:malonic semialdehyde reductase [Pseudoxanthomonas sp. X-1]|uniref:malonic semialdehyde reductase n=1 Tax=Pseudoxanthomonas sp. X-1 TaxID=2571115 RepID=UPI00110B2E9E|nr:malonic semialdehyde reductase [Pseudoxanthomonas sp. X-1]TMN15725.1 malonic semialdehyde reductase [Pseudoxanthomonas sp. X-1]UAY73981.1 malonic semialdehyde reductase [Pseudoxanthomonas sp. X-1]
MSQSLDAAALDQLFRSARTYSAFTDKPVTDETLHALYDLLKWGPTGANSTPARFLFVRSPEAKEKLKPALAPGNVDKTMAAPVTAIVAYDLDFHEQLPKLFPHVDAKAWFDGPQEARREPAQLSAVLQGAYLIMAARALGLDAGPMSGFDASKVDAAFFDGTPVRASFLVNLGYGDASALHPRLPRLSFEEAARIA